MQNSNINDLLVNEFISHTRATNIFIQNSLDVMSSQSRSLQQMISERNESVPQPRYYNDIYTPRASSRESYRRNANTVNRQTNNSLPSRAMNTNLRAQNYNFDAIVNNLINGATMTPNNVDINSFENVVVSASNRDISNGVSIVRFGEILNPTNSTCPISLYSFRSNDNLSQINSCGHLFRTVDLRRWFSRNVRCPLCRFDIRDTPRSSTTTQHIRSNMNLNNNIIPPDSDNDDEYTDDVNPTLPQTTRTTEPVIYTRSISSNNISDLTNQMQEMMVDIINNFEDESSSNDISNTTITD
jgi:hypothetical protein|uniref:RING-type domain-containing protein n=1 Tax=viral metagenome TaxID=1070528 RepID=A0A6C0JGG6_9ZZZZ